MARECERCAGATEEVFLCELTGEHVCGSCEDEPEHYTLHAKTAEGDQFLGRGQCGACGTQDVALTYRSGLDLFLCLPCHAQPNIEAILVDELIEKLEERPD